MPNDAEAMDRLILEMRWRTLSLAADLDRISRGIEGDTFLSSDVRIRKLQRAFKVLSDGKDNRAEQVQMIFSDLTPPPQN